MRHLTKNITLAGVVFTTALLNASPLLQFGENAQLHFLTDLSFGYEDNVFLQEDKLEDTYLIFSPGLELRLFQKGTASATIRYQHQFIRYSDYSILDEEFSDLEAQVTYNSGVVLTNAYASYRERYTKGWAIDEIWEIYEALIRRKETKVGANMKYDLSRLTAMQVGIDYSELDYDFKNYISHDSISVPVTLFYQIRPKIDLTAGLRYRTTDTSNDIEYDDWYAYIGAIGELFSPVFLADFSIGWQDRDSSFDPASDSSMTYDLSLIYTGNPKSTAYITFAQDFNTSSFQGDSYVFTSATLGGNYTLSSTVGVYASVAVGQNDYSVADRKDDLYILRLGGTYRPNEYLSVNAYFNYQDVERDLSGNSFNYDASEIRVTASLRY